MARACGIRIGPRRYEFVVLDGNAKKHKIVGWKAGEFDADSADPMGDAARALKEAAKELHIPKENVGVVIDTGHAAFRRVQLPFTDTNKIEQIIKFEVEGDLPQWNIEDVIVDFHTVGQTDNSCDLLVSAVPKQDVAAVLDLAEKAGIEPLEAELETSAIVNAATAAQICNIDDAQLLVQIGDYSTSVVVMDAGEVREMRVIHIGALTHEVPAPRATEEGPEAPDGAENGDGETEDAVEPVAAVDPVEANRRVDQAVKRIRRELGRTISAARTINPIEAIYVGGMELPGLIGSTVLDVPVYLLDCFDEDGGQPADGYGTLVAAYGSAYRQLGGGFLTPSLRREELRYTGAFEKIEFPLAVACLLLCTMLAVVNILQYRDKEFLENGVLFWLKSSNNYMVGDPKKGNPGRMRPSDEGLKNYAKRFKGDEAVGDPGRTPIESLKYVHGQLSAKIEALYKELGQTTRGGVGAGAQPQSAFVATDLVLGVLEDNKQKWRPSLRKINSTYLASKSGDPDKCKVTLDITFFASDSVTANQHYGAFRDALKSRSWYLDCPMKGTVELESGEGIYVAGLAVEVDVSKFYAEQRLAVQSPTRTPANGDR